LLIKLTEEQQQELQLEMVKYPLAVYSNTCHVYFCFTLSAESPVLHIENTSVYLKTGQMQRMTTLTDSRWKCRKVCSVHYMENISRGQRKITI